MNQKRNTLKKVAGVSLVGAFMPTSWTKPILNAIVLPAHAQTSSNNFKLTSSLGPWFNNRIDFSRGKVTLSGNSIFFDLSFAANVSEMIDEGFSPSLDVSIIIDSNNKQLRVGRGEITKLVCDNPEDNAVATIVHGNNNITIEHPINSGDRYLSLILSFYPSFCGLKHWGVMEFEFDVQT